MAECQDFAQFGLAPNLLSAITRMGYTKPTAIQCKAIPVVLQGRDVMGAAQTGTGKTASFGLPVLQKLLPLANTSTSPARHPVRVLILSPTRELADQTAVALSNYAADTPIRIGVVYGGVDIKPQAEALRRGVEILIATPGRLLDHLEQRNTNLNQCSIVILDEADRMLDMGFLPDISRILNALPKKRQNLMFSATFSPEIKRLAGNFLTDPVVIEVARQNATAATIKQEVFSVDELQKTDALVEILKTRGEDSDGKPLQTIVFVNAKLTARRLARELEKCGFNADAIHGDKTQEERLKLLKDFKDGTLNIMVATDVAARGLDIAELPLVINYDVPFVPEDYVHRIGRTGRAGSLGLALMLVTGKDKKSFDAIRKLTKVNLVPQELDPDPRRRARFPRRASATDNWKAPQKPIDPFFTQPYVPGRPSGKKPAPQNFSRSVSGEKREVAVLLGGTGRKN